MNEKENEFHRIVEIVVQCCRMGDQNREELKEKVLGQCREEPIIMTRCMLARLLSYAGFTNLTISYVLHKSEKSIRHLLELAKDFRNHSKVYRLAEDEAMRKFLSGN